MTPKAKLSQIVDLLHRADGQLCQAQLLGDELGLNAARLIRARQTLAELIEIVRLSLEPAK